MDKDPQLLKVAELGLFSVWNRLLSLAKEELSTQMVGSGFSFDDFPDFKEVVEEASRLVQAAITKKVLDMATDAGYPIMGV